MEANFNLFKLKLTEINGQKIDSKNRIILSDNATISVNIVEAGKSSAEINYKDRVFIQLKIIDNEEVVLTNIVVKLNDKSKVFDIDIL